MQGARRQSIAVGYFFALAGLLFGSWASRIPDVKEQVHAAAGPLGLAMLCLAVGSLTMMSFAGRKLAVVGTAPLMVWGGLGCCAALLAASSARSVPTLSIALLALGASSGTLSVGFSAQAVALEQRAGRPITSRFHSCHSGGGLLGALLGAAGGTWLSPTAHLGALAAVGAIGVCVLGRWLPTERPVAVEGSVSYATPGLLIASALASCAAFSEGAVIAWSSVHLREGIGASAAVAPMGFAALAVCMLAVRASGPALLERWPAPTVLQAAGLTAAAGALLVTLAPVAPLAIIGCAIVGAGVGLVFPTATTAAAASQRGAGDRHRLPTDALAVAMIIGSAGSLLSGPIVGFVAAATSLRVGFALLVVAGLVIAALAPRLPGAAHDEALAPPAYAPA